MAAEPSPVRTELDRVGASFRKAGAANYITVTEDTDDARVQVVWRAPSGQ
jgi:hypothetical protein